MLPLFSDGGVGCSLGTNFGHGSFRGAVRGIFLAETIDMYAVLVRVRINSGTVKGL